LFFSLSERLASNFYAFLKDFKRALLTVRGKLDLQKNADWTIVINGRSLRYALSDDLKMDFLSVCVECKTVICCRTTSAQKAEVIECFQIPT